MRMFSIIGKTEHMSNPLEDAGYRLTEPRRRVLDALREASGPLTAQDVAERAGASVASTYRVLALMVELGLVSETPDDGAALPGCETRGRHYALCTAHEHHHHFFCRSCHATLEVSSDALERALAEIEQTTGFRLEHHDVMLRGQCPACSLVAGAGGGEGANA
jgi:Fur family transcriptional regulator, ferric uptake regulator